jgi:hypothetical protein
MGRRGVGGLIGGGIRIVNFGRGREVDTARFDDKIEMTMETRQKEAEDTLVLWLNCTCIDQNGDRNQKERFGWQRIMT